MGFWQQLFSGQDFMPRVHCGNWTGPLIALHVVSDVIIWLSYLWIPVVMLLAYRANQNRLEIPVAVRLLLILYVSFITACGFTHFFDALMFWNPVYRINGLVRAITACVSLGTAISMVRLMPIAVTAPITIRTQKSLLEQQHLWLRDILDSATSGVLRLCATVEEMPNALSEAQETVEIDGPTSLGRVRKMVQRLTQAAHFDRERADELVTATHEAAMNALLHAGGGIVSGCWVDDVVQIRVEDHGAGIPLDKLPIATLKQGFSTAGTAGQGWFLVLTFVDAAYLLTGPNGTMLVLEMHRTAPAPIIPFSEFVGGEVVSPQPVGAFSPAQVTG